MIVMKGKKAKFRRIRTGRVVILLLAAVVLVSGVVFVGRSLPLARAYLSLLQSDDVYKDDLLSLLQDNPETLQFVLDYEEKKELPVSDTVGDVSLDRVPLFLQWDERWGYHIYGGSLLALTGCGPTCLSMVAVYLTGNVSLTPAVVADMAESNGYFVDGVGTEWSMMTQGAAMLGIQGQQITIGDIYPVLQSGGLIIASVGPGHFTKGGHFIVLAGLQDGGIVINDPNSKANSDRIWQLDEFSNEIMSLWAYSI